MRGGIWSGGLAFIGMAAIACSSGCGPTPTAGYFTPPDGANVTYYPALRTETGPPLVVSASIEAGFMRPFVLSFQQHNPTLSVAYIQSSGGAFFEQALNSCLRQEPTADIYLSASTDQLVRLANEGCAHPLPASVGDAAPGHAQWRNEVVAFTVEPAVFVFSKPSTGADDRPTSHIALLEWLRRSPKQKARVGTYDIEESADGFDFAASDSHQAALYGRLLEALGRSQVHLYCCSNVMVDAVDRGEIGFAYNVQLSYAYAAQRAGSRVSVVTPSDYQALQTVSLMSPRGARSPSAAARFAAFLVSDQARAIARRALAPPDLPPSAGLAQADELLAKASVSPVLLSLQDRARRDQLIQQWREAIVSTSTRSSAQAGERPGTSGAKPSREPDDSPATFRSGDDPRP